MDRKIINELKDAYHITPSNNKEKFIRSIRKRDMSLLNFIFLQCKYLHSYAILKNAFLVFAIIMISLVSDKRDTLLFVSAGIPLIVLVMMYELETSAIYKMEELEKTTRFSLKMLILSRLLIIGIVSLLSVILITIVTYKTKQLPLLETIFTFFMPYFLTILSCMKILRTYKDSGIKYCIVATALISISYIVISNMPQVLNVLYKTSVSTSLLIVSMILVCVESKKYIGNLEECLWN